MPVYSIQVPSGQTLDIQADTPDAAMQGAQQWHAQQQPSGIVDNLREGVTDAAGGLAKGAELAGGGPNMVSKGLNATANWIRPADFVPSSIIDKAGFHPSAILPNLARGAFPTAAAIGAGGLAALAAPEVAGAGIIGAVGTGAAIGAGPAIQQAADNRTGVPNSPVTGADAVRGGLTDVAQALPQAIPMGKYLAPTGLLEKTGLSGVVNAAKVLAKTSAAQGVASAASDVAGQVGQSVGTSGGTTVDPTQALNAGVTGVAMGGLFGAKRVASTALNATALREFANDPQLMQAGTQVANRIKQNADGANLNVPRIGAGIIGGATAQRLGAAAFTKTQSDIGNELNTAVGNLQGPLPVDAQNVLNSALKGQQPTPGGYQTLTAALQSDPQGPNVLNLVRQAHAADIFSGLGNISGDKFTGGIASRVGSMLTGEHVGKSALAMGMGALAEGGAGHIIAYSPEAIGAVAAATALSRLADSVTGARSPAGRIVSNFADSTTPVRLPPPVAPTAQITRPGPTGPTVAPLAQPWGASTPQPFTPRPVAGGTMLTPAVQAEMAARANLAKLSSVPPGPASSGPPVAGGTMLTPAVQAQMAARATLQKLSAANTPPVAAPAATVNPLTLPRNITGPANSIMRGAAIAAKLKADALGQSAATSEVNASPFIQQKVGNAANVPTPAAAKYMSSAVRGANVLAKLQSDPEAAAANKAAAKAQLSAATTAAKAATPAPQITGVTKSDGNVGTTTNQDEYVIPRSPYAHLVPTAAAQQFLADAQSGGTAISYRQGFVNGTIRKITDIRSRAAAVANQVPGINGNEIAAQFEGVGTQREAIAHREWLKKQLPQAAAALDQHFSDEAIRGTPNKAGMWKRVGR